MAKNILTQTGGESKSREPENGSESMCPASDGSPSSSHSDLAVAVIGMACKFPGADSLEQFWHILETGTSMCDELPEDRFPASRFERRAYPKNMKCNPMSDVDAFDHKFFKVASREAMFMDPQQRLALQVAYQALESAGYFGRDAGETERDMGCYVATCMNEYHENVACHPPSAFSLTGSIRPFIAGKVSHHFGWTGPAIMYDTACAASGTAIHQACRAVATEECSSAVAGATNVFVSPDTFQNLARGSFISTTGQSKSFDAAGDGYCRAEGVAFIVLKKLSAALRDGDPIKGVIAATAINQNANECSITVPHAPSQMKLYRKALSIAGLVPRDISYVEAHGTGTPVGDPIEVDSIRGVFSNPSYQSDHRKTYLGSLKSNIGHTEASSGISGLIKVLLMMQKEVIPQQALFHTLNPAIAPLEPDGIEIPRKNFQWNPQYKAACVNNYGASGTNVVMIVTQPPDVSKPLENVSIASYPISITAFSPSSLASYCFALLRFIGPSVDSDLLRDIAYHLFLRKNASLPFSVNGTVSSIQGLKDLLNPAVSGPPPTREENPRPVVLFFGGQTGNTASVPRTFYNSSYIFRKHLDDCDATLRALGAPSIFPAIFEPGPYSDVIFDHSALFSGQYASAMAWLDCGLRPARLIGHSFGQLTALCVSGALSLLDALRLIIERAALIRDRWGDDPGSMIAIEAGPDRVSRLMTQHAHLGLEIACYNGPQSFVLAGSTSSVDTFEAFLESSSEPMRFKRLQIQNAFHTALTDPLIEPLQHAAELLDIRPPKIILETCSKDNTWQKVTPNLVASHTRDPVYFHEAVERIAEELGPCTWLEAGSASAAPMLRRALGTEASSHKIKALKPDPASSLKLLADLTTELWNLGLPVQFWPFHQSQHHQYGTLNLPPYQFDKSRHWLEWKAWAPPAVLIQQPDSEEIPLLRLVQMTKKGGDFKINTQHKEWRTACSEHQILKVPICPLSFLLRLIFKALDKIQSASTQKVNAYCIEYLAVEHPIPAQLENGLTLTISSARNPQSWTFVLGDTPNSSQRYSSGTIFASNKGTGPDFARFQRLVDTTRIRDLTNDTEADSVKGKAVYKSLAGLFQMPKSAQRIKEASAKGKEAAAYIIPLPNSLSETIEQLIQVPLCCLNGLQDRREGEIYIHTTIGQVDYKDCLSLSSDRDISWAVYLKVFESQGSETTCDIFAFDMESGKLSTIMLDVTFTRISIETLRQALGGTAAFPQPITSRESIPAETIKPVKPSPSPSQNPEPTLKDLVPPKSSDLQDLAEVLCDLLARVADVDPGMLRNDTTVADLGIDSLMVIEIAEEINTTFSINLAMDEIVNVDNFGSLCEMIAKNARGFSYDSGAGLQSESDVLDSDGPSANPTTSASSDTKLSSDEEGDPQSTDGSLNGSFKALNVIREEFDLFARQTGCDKFWSHVYPSQAGLIVAYITEAFAKLGVDLSSIRAGQKIPAVPHVPKYDKLLHRLMLALRDDGLISQVGSRWARTSKQVSTQPSSSERFDQILADFPQFIVEHKLLHVVGPNLDACLDGKLDPLSLIFGSQEKRKLMADQYLIAPIQASVSQQLASFIGKSFTSRTSRQTAVRVLEIGGGTCGTSLHAVKALAQLRLPIEYTFTDISPSFVSAAKIKLAEYRFVKYRTLDITADPSSELRGYFDMIIATNVIHATPDTCKSVGHARQMLRPGGVLALVEYTRKLYLLDVIFGQLDGWWAFDDGRDHALMDESQWKAVLARAGFDRVDWTGGRSRESELLRIILAG
ncbi:MAG: hypothetical protein LQ340_001826 [Diploschistes diacapsis]|nr:MAG: hypothetical protein LQ340_001826 [Diploschistes diacapsis]